MDKLPACSSCQQSPAGMIPVRENEYLCPTCASLRIRQLERAIDNLRGSSVIRAIEELQLRYSVRQHKWFVIDPAEPKVEYSAISLGDALALWSDLRHKHSGVAG